ncbi:hypothetical protein AX16_003066 [Volvariella volvacea WC 439]|nr:hypothetical protein AX16_003066 [Volvariella volvacea WC 439]
MTYCERCDKYFRNYQSLDQHKRDSQRHWVCWDCDIDFLSWAALKEHYVQSPRHSYCQYCDTHFDDDDDLETHYEDSHYYCSRCRKVFKNEHGLKEHRRQSPNHNYCAACNREFTSANNLQNHLNSSIHQPKSVPCLAPECNQWFVSRSAMVSHLESGCCISGVTRARVNDFVRRMDQHNVITNPSRLLTDGTEVQYIANQRAWNGLAYECYICHNEFSTLPRLNQHLNSPRHQAEMYFCPLAICGAQFRVLSGLLQHIESERCGISKFKTVRNTLDHVFSSGQRLVGYC